MPPSMTNAQLSLLREQLLTLDLENPDVGQCRAIEQSCVQLLRAGQLEPIKKIVLEVQQLWGSLPEKPNYKGNVRFFPEINPLAHFIDSKETAFLRGINKNYFGFTAAGLALDVPENLFGKREGYLRSVGLPTALTAHKQRFAAFRCESKSQLGAYLQLLSDKSAGHGDHWEFVKAGDVDFTHYSVWAFTSGMLHYPACEGFLKACGFGPDFVNEPESLEPSTQAQLDNQKILLRVLKTSDAAPTIIAFQDFISAKDGNIMSATPYYERFVRRLAADQGVELEKLKRMVGKGLLSINYGRGEMHAEIAGDVINWLGSDLMGKMYKQETLEHYYDFTKSRALLRFMPVDSRRDDHFATDLGL